MDTLLWILSWIGWYLAVGLGVSILDIFIWSPLANDDRDWEHETVETCARLFTIGVFTWPATAVVLAYQATHRLVKVAFRAVVYLVTGVFRLFDLGIGEGK